MYLCNIVNGKRVKMPDTLQVCAPHFFLSCRTTLDFSFFAVSLLMSMWLTSTIWIVYFIPFCLSHSNVVLLFSFWKWWYSWGIWTPVKQVWWINNLPFFLLNKSKVNKDEANLVLKSFLCQASDRMCGSLFCYMILVWWSELPKHY